VKVSEIIEFKKVERDEAEDMEQRAVMEAMEREEQDQAMEQLTLEHQQEIHNIQQN
jgi:hypothetical protein